MYKIFDVQTILAMAKKHKTPFYVYDVHLLKDTLQLAQLACKQHFGNQATIHYALKANDNPTVLTTIKNADLGIDCVSGGEITHALEYGFAGQDIVFAGVGKEDHDIELGLKADIYAFNCESLQEVEVINQIACKKNRIAKIMLRVNPDIDANTHKHISTGTYANKFGIPFSDIRAYLPQLKALKNVKFIGLHYHIGSQITNMQVFGRLGMIASMHYKILVDDGFTPYAIDLGGGLGVDYIKPQENPIANFSDYFAVMHESLQLPDCCTDIHFELGRSLVAMCGSVVSTVLFIKETAGTNFAIIDAGMNDLMRPALYEAKHIILPLHAQAQDEQLPIKAYNVVGPICESTDIFGCNLAIAELQRGDKVAILTAGAYGRVLANQYNRRNMIKEYII